MNIVNETWLNVDDIEKIRSSKYWNDEKEEIEKIFNINKNSISKIESDGHLNNIYYHAKKLINSDHLNSQSKILSLASGTCWLEARLLNERKIDELIAVDFSEHRIHKLAPQTLASYSLKASNIRLIWGDITKINLEENSVDIVLLSQAFHHISDPVQLLNEIKRVLKKNGEIVIVGEHYFPISNKIRQIIFHFGKYLLNYKHFRKSRSFFPDFASLYPSDYAGILKGDIHYSKFQYHQIFTGLGFRYKRSIQKNIQGYVLYL